MAQNNQTLTDIASINPSQPSGHSIFTNICSLVVKAGAPAASEKATTLVATLIPSTREVP